MGDLVRLGVGVEEAVEGSSWVIENVLGEVYGAKSEGTCVPLFTI
jgi:hypothetical protein